ncbi:uncharacterized protein LOC121727458 isoform X2 [Aricia agestis]|nr:uncharacterized protein LOC121727458 isoform X2 [Aricia agestis]
MYLLLCALLVAPALAEPQYIKNGVKGGYGGSYVYNPGAKLPDFYGNSSHNQYGSSGYGSSGYGSSGYDMRNYTSGAYNQTTINYEVGVCYIEVPTASLAKNPAHVPAGNGSRPDLSRVRSCCKGYIRNIHNYQICDPVCTEECVNALCTAPETCTCFPDHVKNLGGFCIPTCPIGCQNGYCSGGECLCKDGYKYDVNGKFCVPNCRENCGGYGNCTAPNVCSCKEGYRPTPEGGCRPASQGQNPNIISPPYNPSHHQNPLGPGSQIVTPNPMHNYPSSPKYPGQYSPGNPGQPGYRNPGQHDSNSPGQRYPGYPYPDQSNTNSLYPNLPSSPYNNSYPLSNSTYPQGTTNSSNPYSNRPNYPGQNPTQPGQPGSNYPYYPSQPGSNNPYPGQSNYPAYPSQPGQVNSSYPGQPWSNNPAYPGSQGSTYNRGQETYSGQQEANQSGYHKQSGYQGQSEYQGQYDYDRSGYQGQASQGQTNQGQHGYYSQSGHHEQSGYNGSLFGYQEQSGNHSQSSYNLHKEAERGDVEPYLPGSQMYGETQQTAQLGDIYQCSEECINGVCINGNKCQCNPGYVLDRSDPTERKCVPYCAGGCTNGVCSAPNFCICNVGYYKDRSVKGRSSACVKRIRRSVDSKSLADLLIFEIPDDE